MAILIVNDISNTKERLIMKKLRSILSTLGAIGLVSGFSMAYAQEWVGTTNVAPLPQVQQVSNAVPVQQAPQQYQQYYTPAPSYAAEVSYDELVRDVEFLKKELAKKSDKPDPKKAFTAPKVTGRVFMDSINVMNEDANRHGKSVLGFREARIGLTGEGYGFLDYKLELGFEDSLTATGNNVAPPIMDIHSHSISSSGTVNFKDVFLGIKYVPVLGYVRIGNQYVEDAGSEICNGTTNYTFMETPAPAGDQFMSRRLGISSRHLFARDRGRLFLGAFGARDFSRVHVVGDDNQGVVLNARLTYAPMFQRDGKCMFLYGGYYSFTDQSSRQVGVANTTLRPGGFRNTGLDQSLPGVADSVHKAGFETVYQNGAFCLQTDFFLRHFAGLNEITIPAAGARQHAIADATAYGGFVMGRYFLTQGDFRKYNLESAAWGSVNVTCPFFLFQRGNCNFMQGPGAWEVATYYGFMNTDDFKRNLPLYGTDHEIGVALNWYWNPQLKWALNYIHQEVVLNGANANRNADILAMSCRFHW